MKNFRVNQDKVFKKKLRIRTSSQFKGTKCGPCRWNTLSISASIVSNVKEKTNHLRNTRWGKGAEFNHIFIEITDIQPTRWG